MHGGVCEPVLKSDAQLSQPGKFSKTRWVEVNRSEQKCSQESVRGAGIRSRRSTRRPVRGDPTDLRRKNGSVAGGQHKVITCGSVGT